MAPIELKPPDPHHLAPLSSLAALSALLLQIIAEIARKIMLKILVLILVKGI